MGARLWRNFQAEGQRPTPEEFELAISLVEKFSSSDVEPEAYTDLYPTKVLAMLEEKSRGHHHCPTASGQVVDLNEALKRSLKQSEQGRRKRDRERAVKCDQVAPSRPANKFPQNDGDRTMIYTDQAEAEILRLRYARSVQKFR